MGPGVRKWGVALPDTLNLERTRRFKRHSALRAGPEGQQRMPRKTEERRSAVVCRPLLSDPGGRGGGGCLGPWPALTEPPAPNVRKTFLRQKMKFIKGAENLRPSLGKQTFLLASDLWGGGVSLSNGLLPKATILADVVRSKPGRPAFWGKRHIPPLLGPLRVPYLKGMTCLFSPL